MRREHLAGIPCFGKTEAGHAAVRDALADAVGTTRERVSVHVLDQHNAPGTDYSTEALRGQVGAFDTGVEGTDAPTPRRSVWGVKNS